MARDSEVSARAVISAPPIAGEPGAQGETCTAVTSLAGRHSKVQSLAMVAQKEKYFYYSYFCDYWTNRFAWI